MQRTPRSSYLFENDPLPIIDSTEPFRDVVAKLAAYFTKSIDAAYTWEQLRTTIAGHSLRPLILRLSEECHHPALVAALLTVKYQCENTDDDGTGLSESRGLACEIVAWQFLLFLSEKELIDCLLYELPTTPNRKSSAIAPTEARRISSLLRDDEDSERTALLEAQTSSHGYQRQRPPDLPQTDAQSPSVDVQGPMLARTLSTSNEDWTKSMEGMNALEIAAIANAKKFLSQRPVQKIVDDIWSGNVIFWESLSVEAVKKPRAYNKRTADPFTRLRVPKYQKALQVAYFVALLALYYAVLVERNPMRITWREVLLYIWIAAFAYDEIGEIQDAGILFYRIDFWSLWDISIIVVSGAFMIARTIGLAKHSAYITDIAFDILSMVALFLVPRIFSVMSLNPYFGSLIPVLKEMTKAFCKFLPVIVVLYLGFLTTFTMLARDRLTLNEMSWLLIKVFFGSSYLGFDVAVTISPVFGYTLMLIFVCLTNILLITSLVSLVSNSLTEVMAHAREEYLFQYSIYVLESSTSRRLTYFMPPLNLIPLLLLRPLRLVLPSEIIRRIRIVTLKATHIGFVAIIWAYEESSGLFSRGDHPLLSRSSRSSQLTPRPLSANMQSFDYDRGAPRPSSRPAQRQDALRSAPSDSASRSANVDMIDAIQKLSAQIEELTAMVAGQYKD